MTEFTSCGEPDGRPALSSDRRSTDSLIRALGSDGRTAWIGGVGVEERGVSSLDLLNSLGAPISEAVRIEYPSKPYSVRSKARTMAAGLLGRVDACLRFAGCTEVRSIFPSPHSALAVSQLLGESLHTPQPFSRIFVDLSSLTRAHLVGLAYELHHGCLAPTLHGSD